MPRERGTTEEKEQEEKREIERGGSPGRDKEEGYMHNSQIICIIWL